MDPKLKHDFVNNCLRIEVLQKIMLEDLEAKKPPKEEHLIDYQKFLKEQIEHCQELFN